VSDEHRFLPPEDEDVDERDQAIVRGKKPVQADELMEMAGAPQPLKIGAPGAPAAPASPYAAPPAPRPPASPYAGPPPPPRAPASPYAAPPPPPASPPRGPASPYAAPPAPPPPAPPVDLRPGPAPTPPTDLRPAPAPTPQPTGPTRIGRNAPPAPTPEPAPNREQRIAPSELAVLGEFGPYDILGRLAMGGMAEIMLARKRRQTELVVVKKLLPHMARDEDIVAMFQAEAFILSRLEHPNIVAFQETGQHEGAHFIEMEFVDGAPLRKVLDRSRGGMRISTTIACAIEQRLASALHHAHEARDGKGRNLKVVHRDVNPENVMISYDGQVKLFDFGIAKATVQSMKTRAGVMKGKFAYMAPEQYDRGALDRRVDVFALGTLLYELLTGVSPFLRDSEAEMMRAILEGPTPQLAQHLPGAPEALQRIIDRALAKNPDERFPTTAAFAMHLGSFLESHGGIVPDERIAHLMRTLFADELHKGPSVYSTPFGSSYHEDEPPDPAAAAYAEADLDVAPAGAAPKAQPADLPVMEKVSGTREIDMGPQPLGTASTQLAVDTELPAPRSMPVPRPRPVKRAPARPEPTRGGGGGGRTAAIVIGALLFVGGLGAGAWFLFLRGDGETAEPEPDPVAETTTDPADTTGAILVASVPAGARVFNGGSEAGVTPLELDGLEPGTYHIHVSADGFEMWSQEVELAEGQIEALTARLREAMDENAAYGDDGMLSLDTSPPTTVYLGSTELGRTPIVNRPVASGVHLIELELPHGERRRTRIYVPRSPEVMRTHINISDLPPEE